MRQSVAHIGLGVLAVTAAAVGTVVTADSASAKPDTGVFEPGSGPCRTPVFFRQSLVTDCPSPRPCHSAWNRVRALTSPACPTHCR